MTEAAEERTDILIVSAGVGAGHNQAAKAILEGLKLARPGVSARHIDILDLTNAFFRMYYSGGFAFLATRAPWLYGFGFWLFDRPNSPRLGLGERLRMRWERLFLRRFEDLLLRTRPRLIVHTHFLAAPFISHLMRNKGFQTRQIVAVTDNVVHRWWHSRDVEHYFLPAEIGVPKVRSWGVPPERITVAGMPIHPKWVAAIDHGRAIADWRLPADKKIVLLTGGTEYTCGPIVKIAGAILAACPESAVVVLAGRNKQLLADLSKQPLAGTRLFPQGFTDRAQELVELADVMITKPGGITTAECLCKGTPMVLLRPVPGQEGGNARYFADEGAATVARTPADVIAAVRRITSERSVLAEMSANAHRLYRPGTQTIVNYVLKTVP